MIMAILGCDSANELIKGVSVPMEVKNYSDLIKFQYIPPMGSEEVELEGDTLELLKNIPYLFRSGVIPSVDIINNVLSKGLSDAGMSGGARWIPYQIDITNFNELVEKLKLSEGLESIEYIEPDAWVSDFED